MPGVPSNAKTAPSFLVPVAMAVAVLVVVAAAADPAQLVRDGLPGQPAVGFQQYAGFVPAGGGKHLFYWFVTAQQGESTSKPVAFWFNGGPGCSSVGNGGLRELGPFFVNASGTGLVLNQFAWNRDANIVFVESPIGVGYSYSVNSSDYDVYTDDQTAEDAHAFLVGWLHKFPEYAHNDIYLTGESYAGHYVPQLAQKVVEYNARKGGQHINLKGVMIGNAWTDPYSDNRGATEFYYAQGMISEKTYTTLLQNCDFAYDLPVDYSLNNQTCADAAHQALRVEMRNIDMYNIHGETCPEPASHGRRSSSAPQSTFFRRNLFLQNPYPDPCNDPIRTYLNLPEVVQAFHASNSTNVPWQGCSYEVSLQYKSEDVTSSVLPVYPKLIKEKLRIWIFSGDVDGIVPTLSTRFWLSALRLPIRTRWYAWNETNQVGGWTEKYKGLTFATVHNAGHMVPLTQPQRAFTLFQHFLKDEPLPAFQSPGDN